MRLNVKLNKSEVKEFQVSIMTIRGEKLNTNVVESGMDGTQIIEISNLIKGVYLIRIETGNSNNVTKIIVQ